MALGLGLPMRARYGQHGGAIDLFDFTVGRFRRNWVTKATFASVSGLTVTRASPAVTYAETAAGVLVPFSANEARFTDKGLLVEEGRSNLVLQSQTFDHASWTKGSGASITANAVAAPDGTTTADTWNGTGYLESAEAAVSASTAHAGSLYFKAGTATTFSITLQHRPAYGASVTVQVNPVTGATSSLSGSSASVVVDTMANGWFRLRPTGTTAGGATGQAWIINGADGTLHLWGAQMEVGSFATSYIPTTTAAVARSADSVSITGSWAAPMTVYAEWDQEAFSAYRASFGLAIAASPTSNSAEVYQATSASATLELYTGGGAQTSIGRSPIVGRNKLAARIATNDVNVALNGAAATADTIATIPTYDRLALAANRDLSIKRNGYLRVLAIYPYAANDAELQRLTA